LNIIVTDTKVREGIYEKNYFITNGCAAFDFNDPSGVPTTGNTNEKNKIG